MQSNVIAPKKGLQLDNFDVEQQQDNVTMAINAVVNTVEGEGINYATEPGFKHLTTIDEGYQIVGHVNMERAEQAVFTTNGSTGQIGVLKNGSFEVIAQSDDFPFSLDNPITGIYQLREGCQRVIFFQDKYSFDYYFNLDRPEDFKTNGVFDIRKFRLQQELVNPCITATALKIGTVQSGQYRFILEMLDDDFNVIGYSHASAPVFLYETGGIEVYVTSISSQVSFVRFYVVQYIDDASGPGVYRFAEEPVSESEASTTFEGIGQDAIADELSKFLIRPIIYESSQQMLIVDNRLVRFGPKEQYIDYSEFQKAASKIRSYYKMLPDRIDNYNDAILHQDTFPTLMGDEIYSVGIVYQFPEFVTPQFHIPGPGADQVACDPVGEGSGTGDTYNTCLKVKTIGYSEDGQCSVQFTVTYTIDGGSIQTYSDQVMDGADLTVVCLPGAHDIAVLDLVQNTIGANCGDLEVEAYVTTEGINIDPGDIDLLTTWNVDMEFLGIENQAQLDNLGGVPKWKVYNTAKKLGTYHGRPGYYQAEETYENPFNCVSDYWGVDACGNSLEGTPIRHHRMPDRTLEPIYRTGGYVWRIGMDFDNIEYPHPDIIGHYFVFRKRTQKTILDKGFLVPMMYGELDNVFTYIEHDNQSNEYQVFFSPYTNKGKSLEGSYYKLETRNIERRRVFFEENFNKTISDKNFYIGSRSMFYDQYADPTYTNLSIRNELMLQPAEVKKSLAGQDVSNLSFNNFALATKLSTSISGVHFAALKVWRSNMYADLFSGEYLRLHPCMKTINGDQSCFDGDTFATEFRMVHTTIRRVKESIWDDILLIGAVILAVAITVVTAGVGIVGVGAGLAAIVTAGLGTAAGIGAIIAGTLSISVSIIKATTDLIKEGEFEEDYLSKDDDDFEPSNEVGSAFQYYAAEIVENLYVESDSNYAAARKEFEFEAGNVFKDESDVKGPVIDYLYQKIAYYDKEEERYIPKVVIVPEIYEYSNDYRFHPEAMLPYYPIPITTDFCSKCSTKHPNWIVWSNQSFTDSVSDAMRIFLSENYVSVGSNTGAITDAYYDGSAIWVRTMQSMWRMAPNPQIIKTDASQAYIGTGSFLGVPTDQINPVNYGFAGGQGRHDSVVTEFGWVTADVSAGRVFLINEQGMAELTNNDANSRLEMWMLKNMPLEFPQYMQDQHGVNYSQSDTTLHPMGVGVILFYDPFLKRVIIHKRDFRMLKGDYYDRGQFVKVFSDRNAYQDLSFTLSYSLKEKMWTSMHSYMPAWAWNNDKDQFIVERNNKIWTTDKHTYGNYFGVQYPFVVEVAHVGNSNYILDIIDYHSQVRRYSTDDDQWIEVYGKTFDKVWIYNEWSSTKLMNVLFKDEASDPWTSTFSPDSLYIERSSDNYRLSGFFDIASSQPVATKNWQKRAGFYNNLGHGYMDSVPNEDALNIDATQWDLNDMSGKYHKIRFFFSNENGYKMVMNLLNTILTMKQI